MLFTTRNVGLAPETARVVALGILTPDQALKLLRDRTGKDDPAFSEIAERLGYHPLALSIAAGHIAQGIDGAVWLERCQHVADIKSGPQASDRYDNLTVCFDLSMAALGEPATFYYTFGIVPEDVAIPESVILRLWRYLQPDLSETDALAAGASRSETPYYLRTAELFPLRNAL
jgi:hypothetical protein